MRIPSLASCLLFCLTGLLCASDAFAQTDITTWQVDTKHTGVNANETILTPSFVSTNGNLVVRYVEKVDGQVFAQPLYLSGATSGKIPGNWVDGQQHKDVVFVVTENATLYAFDADQEPNYKPNIGFSNPIWSLHLVPAGNTTAVPIPQIDTDSALDIRPLFGDTATPVIDPKGGIIYVVSALKDTATLPASHPYEQLLWAINLKSGQPVNGSPVVINPQFNGAFSGDNRTPCTQANHVPNTPSDNGCENDNEPVAPAGTIPFYPLHSHLRSALTLDSFNGHNNLYLAYASHSDGQPYAGFIVGYDAASLKQTTEFTTMPDNTFEAGIWMAGASPAIDPALNKMYVITGNGGNWDNKDSNNKPLPAMGVDSQGNVFSKGTNWPMSVLAFDTTPVGTVAYRGQNELQVPFADTSVWFTLAQWDSFNNGDQDLGAGGALLFDTPAPDGSTKQLLIGGGKAGVMYVLDRTNLGGIDASQGATFSRNIPTDFVDDNVVQEITFPNGTGFFNTPVFFNNHIYFSGGNSGARSRAVGFNQTTNTYISSTEDASPEGPVDKNAGVFISANGTSNGLVWQTANGIRAWDAGNLAKGAIFSQNNIQVDDGSGNTCITPTFSLPIVSGGSVYFSCYQNPTTTGVTTSSNGTQETFVQPSDNKPGYLFVYGQAPVSSGAPTQVPLNVTAQANSESQITVRWTDPDSGQPTAHTGFNVFRATCVNCAPVQIAATSDLEFIDTGLETLTAANGTISVINLTPNTTYFYTVKATNSAGSSNASSVIPATTFEQYAEAGLVAYWPMDEGVLQGESATSSADVTGNGHTALKDESEGSNEIESTASGYIGGSWQYHGTTVIDRLVIKNAPDLQFTAKQSFSLVAWVNPTTLQGFSGPGSTQGFDGASIIVKSRDQGNYYGLWINLNGQWEARGPAGVVTGSAATAGAWTQLALVQDGPNNKRLLYVNGKLAGQGPAQDASGAGDLWFGQQNLFGTDPTNQTMTDGFQGNIDEVRIYNTVVTPTQLLNQFSDPVFQATSVQTHAGTPLGIPVYPLGTAGVPLTEPRVSPNQTYTIQLNFSQSLSVAPAAALIAQPGSTQAVQGTVASTTLDSTGLIVTVKLANVTNAQALQLHVTGLTSEASQNATYDLPFNILEGDISGDHVVDATDANAITALIANNNNPVTSANAQFDLNLDGVINATDAALVSSLNPTSLQAPADGTLAAFKLTSASTSFNGNLPAFAVDNNLNTRWESVQGAGADPSSLVIDLNNTANIHSIILDWENAAGANYLLQVSSDPSVVPEASVPNCSSPKWTTIQTVTGNTNGGFKTYSGLTANGRFVRMCGETRTTAFGYSLIDFQVIGSFVSGTGTSPVITSATSATATVGQPFSYTITSNPTAASFNATGLPAGLGHNGAVISGTPTVAGSFNVALSATNSTGQTGTATLALTVSNVAPSLPAAPTGVTPAAVSSSQINLTWTASTTPGVTYSVFRSTTSGFTPSAANQIAQGLTTTTFSDTALTASTTYFYVVATVNGAGSTAAPQASAQTQAASGVTEVIAINTGSATVVTGSANNATFIGDTDFVGGNDDAPGQAITIPAAIANVAAPAAVYADAHQGGVTYTIPNLVTGNAYTVVLHFAELFFTSANSRLFNVSINGVQVLQNFDIFAAAGNAAFTAAVQSFPNITPVNNQIVIAFTNGARDQPMINGIEIQTGGTAMPSAPTMLTAATLSATQVNLNWNASVTSGVTYSVFRSTTAGFAPSTANRVTQNLTATGFSDAALTPSTVYYYVVEAANAAGALSLPSQQVSTSTAAASADVIAINAGSPTVVGSFIGDTDFNGGNDDVSGHAITIPAAIANIAAPAAVYANAHQGGVTYTIPNLTAGKTYTVILHFAELYFTTANSRQFNVSINGDQVLQNFDIFAAAGNASFTAVVQTFANIAPVNGEIVLAFTNGAHDQPMVNGIEIQ